MMQAQKGVGLMEVLVALLLLSIAILGFVGLQVRAIAASNEAGLNVQATNLARDLAERMRVNRDGIPSIKTSSTAACSSSACTSAQMANYDYRMVQAQATALGMSLDVLKCEGISRDRQCIYVAWEGTTASNGTADTDCTNGTAYVPNAKGIIMEVYNND